MPSPHTIAATEQIERLKVMKRQESTHYMIPDYLSPEWQARLAEAEVSDHPPTNESTPPTNESTPASSSAIELWREKICEWCYNVVDHYELPRESVSVAMNILDRYVSSRLLTPKTYTLAGVTAIHIAVKLVSQYKLCMSHLLALCAGKITADDIASMELTMLSALSWRVSGPTAADFCGELIDSSFTETTPHALNGLHDMARYLTELAVCEYFFVTRKPSSIALASISYAIELTNDHVHHRDKDRFISRVAQVGLDIVDDEVTQCHARLRVIYRKNVAVNEEVDYDGEVRGDRGQGSPTGVGGGPDNTCKKRKRVKEVDKEGRLITEHGEEIARFSPV
jgi:lipoyl(octanoyl) transferase